ncbi:TonB-dependent receptor [Acidisoma cellulosilytica]|uniref:TonB-dependent receptor n=1 Tax=Acidisoma cellulosilyticum TaxID=2802395 RepID=A0A963Z260_9PROT|nr:TonB-dependent receptor [Acidisoma cellulosilyticum]MCB8880490.1 TonB-dependent receptor [Acidisoma cellulosilyticum]
MKSLSRWLLAGSALGPACLLIPTLASAQSDNAQDQSLKPLVVRATQAQPGDNTTAISHKTMQQQGSRKLDDVLRSTAGVYTRQSAQQAGVAVNIRGFEGSGRVNMSIDGVRQSFGFTDHEAAGFTYVDPNLLSGIDISRGQVTGIGGGALAGTVDFHTLGVDDIVKDGQTFGALSRVSLGSNSAGLQSMIGVGAQKDGVGVVAAIDRNVSGDYRDGDYNSVAHSGQNLTSGLAKTQVHIGTDQTFGLGAVIYNNNFYADSYYQTIHNNTVSANYAYTPGGDLIDFVSHVYYNELNMKYTGGTGSYIGRKIYDQGIGGDAQNKSHFNVHGVQITSANGFEIFHDNAGSRDGGVNPGTGQQAQVGVFTDNTLNYGIFSFSPSLRYQYFSENGNGYLSTGFGNYTVGQSKGKVEPKLTLAVQATPWLQPYVSWSESMRAPTVQETMLGGEHPGTVSASFIPNPYLKPETDTGWEFGTNSSAHGIFTADDAFTARGDFYLMNVSNYITGAYVASQGAYQFQNIAGTSKVDGVELQAKYDAGFAFATFDYTHSHSDLPATFSGLGASQYLPDNVVATTVAGRLLQRKLTLGANYQFTSGGWTTGYNSTLTAATTVPNSGDPYNLVGLFASYQVTDNINVHGEVTNLFNANYVPFLSTTGNGPGRTLYVGTEVRF